MSQVTKWALLAVLAAIAAGYFSVVLWKAGALARVLLRRGYAERGFDEPRLTTRLRALGIFGLALSVASFAAAASRLFG